MSGAGARARLALAGMTIALAASSSSACVRALPPTGQIVLYVDTDAIVRAAPGVPVALTSLSPMIDRARFAVLQGGKPLPNSTRDVPIDAQMLQERRLSFGVVLPPHETDVTVRVRLFRADRVFGAEPDPGVTLESVVALPPVEEEGLTELSIVLHANDFGVPIGPVPPSPGALGSSLVGTVRGGKRVPCTGDAERGAACVPGATFFFGNPQFRGRAPTNDIYAERLVFVSPFFLDVTEVTVGAFRAAWPMLRGKVAEPVVQGPGDAEYCTWSAQPVSEVRALNCVTWATAEAYCELNGQTLPSEAQFELVTSGAGEELAFPWGNDEPDCSEAVWGLGGIPSATSDSVKRGADNCRVSRTGAGPLQPGQGLSDKIGADVVHSAGGDEIQDLGGNVSEWMRDVWARPTDSFWSGVKPMVDPVNAAPNAIDGPDIRPVRGGDWASTALTTRAGFRRQRAGSATSTLVGFRCARAMRAPIAR